MSKCVKGTRDIDNIAIETRNFIMKNVREVFLLRGGCEIDTPVMELRDFLTSKFIDTDDKLVYDLMDQGGENTSLRYDLTMPLMRYIGTTGMKNWKRFQFGKVYRRDQPSFTKGRWREFMQADFDIVGNYSTPYSDFEILSMISQIFNDIGVKDFVIKINYKFMLDNMLKACGVPIEMFSTVCSSIDKLDKIPRQEFKRELVGKSVGLDVIINLMKALQEDKKDWWTTDDDVSKTYELLVKSKVINNIKFEPTLARGLDYYTGIIFEVVFPNSKYGSMCGGGRYDNLISTTTQFQGKCIGFSIGIDRVLDYMMSSPKVSQEEEEFSVLTATIDVSCDYKVLLVDKLNTRGIRADYFPNDTQNLQKQLTYALKNKYTFIIIIGKTEIANGTYKVKNLITRDSEDVPMDGISWYLKNEMKNMS